MSKIINIPGRIHSTEKGNVSVGANEVLDDTKGKKQNVINSETDAELLRLSNEKQDNLTFDNAPTEGSNNPVKSSGVYAADKALSDAIEAILLLIPSAASQLNKLVDLATMDSSISTATATFSGTYNAVTDLHLTYQATHEQIAAALDALNLPADNNDYAFVQVPVSDESTEIRRTERYKHNGTNWGYEYDLNTSGFTAAQWAAINSGITALLVAKLSALPTAAELTTLLGAKQDTLTFDTEPTALSTNPVTSGGVYAAILAVSTALTTYQGVIDPKIAAIEGKIPSGASSSNQLTAKDYVDGIQTTLQGYIDAINGKIPAAAAANNQLTDKNYVDTIIAGITAKIPYAASGENQLVDTAAMMTYVAGIINDLDASFNVTSSDGHITLHITQVDGVITSVQVQGSDIASAAALTTLTGRVTTAEGNISANASAITTLQNLYNSLQQSAPQVIQSTDTWPVANPSTTVIYRVIDRVNTPPEYYSDYMWNGTSMVLMATYNNAVDTEPTYESNNLVKSGGVYSAVNITELSFTTLGYIKSDGSFGKSNPWKHTGLVEIFPKSRLKGNVYGTNGSTLLVAFYDKNRVFISGVTPTGTGMEAFDVDAPNDAYYVCVGTKVSNLTESYVKVFQTKQINYAVRGLLINEKYSSSDFDINGYLKTDGSFSPMTTELSWKTTDYIPVKGNGVYSAELCGTAGATSLIAFYDEYKRVVSVREATGGTQSIGGFIPSTAAYMRACNYITQFTDQYVEIVYNAQNILSHIENQLGNKEDKNIKYKYHHNIHKPYGFGGKNVVFFGDSVTKGVFSDNGSAQYDGQASGYWYHLRNILSLTNPTEGTMGPWNNRANFANSAACICDPDYDQQLPYDPTNPDVNNSILNVIISIVTAQSDYDFIFIAGGVNDYSTGKPLGSQNDTTQATFYGSLHMICEHLATVLSGKETKVIFITPMNWSRTIEIQNVAELNDYRNAIFEIATMYGHSVVDGSVIGFPNENTDTPYRIAVMRDGVHPTKSGHIMMAQNIASILL